MEKELVKLITVDPGVKKSAIALWSYQDELLFADDLSNSEVTRILIKLRSVRLLVETPVLYLYQRKKHKDVGDLARVAKCFKAISKRGEGVQPSVWKGQVPKKVHGARIIEALKKEEIEKAMSIKNHNTIDAVGIGLWALGRLSRGGR